MSPTRSSGSEPTCTGRWRIRFGLAPRLHSIGPMTSWPGESTISRPVSDPRLGPVPEEAWTMTQIYHRHDITLDQVVTLKTAATRLGRDFDGTFNTETIERFLHSSYDQFAGHATIANFLPLLADPFPRQRLPPLAKFEADPTTAGRPCCSCARTTPADRRWHWASSSTTPAAAPSPGPAARNPATGLTRPPSRR